jgi:archaellum biogenesis ATPase FlaH
MRRQHFQEEQHPSAKKAQAEPVVRKVNKKSNGDRKQHEKAATIPHDPMNEQVVIAAALVSQEERKKLVRQLSGDFFYARGHASIWGTIEELDRKNLVYDPATIHQLSDGEVDTGYLDDLIQSRPVVPANLAHHVGELCFKRRCIEFGKGPMTEMLDKLQDPSTTPEEYSKLARQMGNWFDGTSTLKFLRDADSVQLEMERGLDSRVARYRSGHIGHPYGLDGFDFYPNGKPRIVSGVAPSEITLIVGASGNGKTTVMNQIVLAQMAMGKRVLHGAWEKGGEGNLEMLAGFSIGIDRARIRIGDLTDEEVASIKARARDIRKGKSDYPLLKFFDLPFDQTKGEKKKYGGGNERNLDIIHEHVEMSGCDVAVFDLFHQALVETNPDDEKRALDRMQAIAKATKAHLIVLHHVGKEAIEKSEGHVPTRNSIRGSGAWLNAADTTLATHVPGVYKRITNNKLEIHILKQREGDWPLCVQFDYDPKTGLISNGEEVEPIEEEDAIGADPLQVALDKKGKRR